MDTMMAINQQIRTHSPDSVQPEICNQLKLHEPEPVETQVDYYNKATLNYMQF